MQSSLPKPSQVVIVAMVKTYTARFSLDLNYFAGLVDIVREDSCLKLITDIPKTIRKHKVFFCFRRIQ